MKTIIILGDGMADLPIESLGNRTCLQSAHKPNIDRLAKLGRNGLFATVPLDMPPGSEVANLAVLGYDVRQVYQGRGVLEAAAMGVQVEPDDFVMRCNLLCIQDGKIKNHSAGHISTAEAHELIDALNEAFSCNTDWQSVGCRDWQSQAQGQSETSDVSDGTQERFFDIRFYPGVSYRHIFVLKNGNPDVSLTPPHDVPGTPWKDVLPVAKTVKSAPTAALLTKLIEWSHEVLANHPVNLKRIADGKDPANSIWFWSGGKRPQMQTYAELYGKTGAVISAVDLLHGIGVYAGFKVIHVKGATGLYDTNYEGKVAAALEAIRDVDMVYLHIEAADEAGHEGNVALKVRCIEDLDARVVKPIMEATQQMTEPICLALLPDHPTPCSIRTHTHDPIPFVIFKPGVTPDTVDKYDEQSASGGSYGLIKGDEFIRAVFS